MENKLSAAMLAHNNTHSTSRILRNIKLIRQHMEDAAEVKRDVIEFRLHKIEQACYECQDQVDELYLIAKDKTITLEQIKEMAEKAWEGCDGCDENDKHIFMNGYIRAKMESNGK